MLNVCMQAHVKKHACIHIHNNIEEEAHKHANNHIFQVTFQNFHLNVTKLHTRLPSYTNTPNCDWGVLH